MNAADMKRIMNDRSEVPESFCRELERLAQRLIGEEYDAVYDFFREVLEYESVYKIICARRCQVLFELFCPIILLDDDVEINGTFISSNSLERHRQELCREDVSVLIVDDVLIHGRGVKRLYELFDPGYSRHNIKVAVFCRSVNATCLSDELRQRILNWYPLSFDYGWREISCRFVDFIETSAIPYESFAGGLLSFSGPALSPDDDRFVSIVNSDRSRVFFEKCAPPPLIKTISHDMCLRTYTNEQSGVFSFVPYVFLKNIRSSACNDLFSFFALHLSRDRCAAITRELSACGEDHAVYRMRLFSSLVNRIYGIYLNHKYGVMETAHPTRMNMTLCFGSDVAGELAELRWQDISGLLTSIPPFEEGTVQEDGELDGLLLLPDRCEDDAMYRFLSMYYYSNGQLDEAIAKEGGPRRDGLTLAGFYGEVAPELCHEFTAAQIKCWDLGQASGIMRVCGTEDCIAMYGVAGEQNFRFILQENRDHFRKLNKKYIWELSGIHVEDDVAVPILDAAGDEADSDAFSRFAVRNNELLRRFVLDNKDRLEEWYIPQFIS